MRSFISILLFSLLSILFSTKVFAQEGYDKVYFKLLQVDSINDNYAAYRILDSLQKLTNLSNRSLAELKLRLSDNAVKLQRFNEASKYAHEGILIAEKYKIDTAYVRMYRLIGVVQYYMQKFPESINYFKKCAQISKEKNILFQEVVCYQSLGGVYIDLKELDSGMLYLNRAIELSKNCGPKCTPARLMSFRLLATLYERRKEFIKADKLYSIVENEAKVSKDTNIICSFLVYHAQLLYAMGKKQKALAMSEKAYQLLDVQKGRNNHSYHASMMQLAKLYSLEGRYKEEAELRKKASVLQGENFRKENIQVVNELETKFKVKELEQEKNLAKANILAEKQQKQILYLILFGIVLVAALLFTFIRFKNKKQQAEQKVIAQKALLNSILETEEKERSRIAKDLHDGIVQDLTAIKMNLHSTAQTVPDAIQSQIQEIYTAIDTAAKDVREISYQMMPVTLKELGLLKALEELLNRSLSKNNIQYHFDYFGLEQRLAEKIEVTVYRICQELLNNTIKHSKATNVSLLLQLKNNLLQLTYEDDGIGFNANEVKKGIGLNSLNSRLEIVKGSLEFDSIETNGTTAYIRIPV